MNEFRKSPVINLVEDGITVRFLVPEEGSSERFWPSPPPSKYRIHNKIWAYFQRAFHLPAFIDYLDVRALFEREFEHAFLQLRETVELPRLSLLLHQIKSLALSPVGSSIPNDLHSSVYELLANMALRDKEFGNGKLSAYTSCRDHVESLTTVTPELKRWAKACHNRKAADLAPYTPKTGTVEIAERIFISTLCNLWSDRLGRTLTNWDDGDGKAADFTRFVAACLRIVGVRYAGRRPTLSAVRHRVRRVLREIELAEAEGLYPSVLARSCNPGWRNSSSE